MMVSLGPYFARMSESTSTLVVAAKNKCSGNVYFTPKSGHFQRTRPCLFWAKSGLMHRSKEQSLFDHLVGTAEHLRWHCETQGLGRLEIDHQAEFRWRLHRKVTRFLAFEYGVDV
jgi:hypothetical protein